MPNIAKSLSFKWSIIWMAITVTTYLLTFRFYAYWSLLIAFGDFAIITVFFIHIVANIISWTRCQREHKFAAIPLTINILTILAVYFLPSINTNKNYHLYTASLCGNKKSNCPCTLYTDYYCIYKGGATTSDLDAIYLTDFKNFKAFIGVYDESDEMISVECIGDSIRATKVSNAVVDIRWTHPRVLEQQKFSIKNLIKNHNFD